MMKLRALNSSYCCCCLANKSINFSIFISFHKSSHTNNNSSSSSSSTISKPKLVTLLKYFSPDSAASHYFNNSLNFILNYKEKLGKKALLSIDSHSKMTQPTINYFAHSFIDRSSDKRKNKKWIQSQMTSNESVFVLFHVDKPFVAMNDSKTMYSLYRFNYDQVKCVLDSASLPLSVCIFLGVEYEKNKDYSEAEESSSNTMAGFRCQSPYSHPNKYNKNVFKSWFAIDLANEFNKNQVAELFKEQGQFFEGNFLRVMAIQDLQESSIIAQARSVFCWIDRNRHCASCGEKNEISEAGFKLSCRNTECKSNNKILNKYVPSNIHYPRVDPVVIMLIINPNKTHVLLGRKKQFPKKMFSCLAGYVEAGESIEEAVRRESFEESGVYTDKVVYHSSQPWPFPSTLMIGCMAFGCSTDLNVDTTEIEEARWFSQNEISLILSEKHPENITIPSERTIAHQLIAHWNQNSKL